MTAILLLIILSTALMNVEGKRNKVHLLANRTKLSGTTARPPPTAPPPPPPPKSCAEDGKCTEENKKCNADLKCVCDVHFREISDGSCVPKPQLSEQCFVDNVSWLECDGDGVDSTCSTDGPNKGKCVCAKGHEPTKDGKRCSPIRQKLGDECSNDAECISAYAACVKGKCSCIDGFKVEEDICKPNEYRCPSGQAKQSKDGVVACEVDFNDTTGTIGDNCGSGHFCFVPPHTLSASGKPRGHCCPSPSQLDTVQLVCPYGEPLKNASCPDRKKDDVKKPNTCPPYSHTCFSVQARPHDAICCAAPCRQSITNFDHDGRCFDYVLLGKPCELTAQCTGQASCAESGGKKLCKCKKGFAQVSANQCEETR